MEKLNELFHQFMCQVEDIEDNLAKLIFKENKSAGKRVQAALKKISKLSVTFNSEIEKAINK